MYKRYWEERNSGTSKSIGLKDEEIPYCEAEIKEKTYLKEYGWWILCSKCLRWFPSTFGKLSAHTVDGYIVYGGCCIGDGVGMVGSDDLSRGQPTSEVKDASDAALLRYGINSVKCIADALRENRLGPIHYDTLKKAVSYIERVNLDGEDALLIKNFLKEAKFARRQSEKKEALV